ncbi:MAG: transglycosylase SLT domain-containing protein [Desulfobacter sp.]|nr:MAG: transglycosylase SLT domain-containing protein [Desulfobacter sp.]
MTTITMTLILLALPFHCAAWERYNRVTKYDSLFIKYTKRYFGPGFNWREFKSQAISESGLNEDARSAMGARGIMQIMPRTFEEIKYKTPAIRGTIQQPRWSIAAGIAYDRSIWNIFKEKRPLQDRKDFMFGAYNAGKGSIIKAQKKADSNGMNPNRWTSIEITLPEVTGARSKETINYVTKIKQIKKVLK